MKVEFLIYGDGILTPIFGAWAVLFLAVFSYVVDITTEKNRTYRLGFVGFSVYVGMPIGVALGGFLLSFFGYLTVYITSLTISVINLTYLIFVLSDPVRTEENKIHDNRGFVYFMKIFFSPMHFFNTVKAVFRKTGNDRRLLLCILLAATCFMFGPMYGTMTSILIISKALGWHDSVLGILSASSKIFASFVYCFALTGGVFFLGPFVDILNGTTVIAIRSIFSKSVEPHEIGKLNSLIGITEVLTPMIYVPLYTSVYTATLEVLPGAVFLMGAALTIPALLVFTWLLYRHLRSTKLEKLKGEDCVQTL